MEKKKINPWSLVAVFSAIGFCPLFTIAAILFGIRALVDISAKGDTRGVRLAWFSILFGSLMTGLWGGGMYWWNLNVRSQIEQGPIKMIALGQDGNIEAFESLFITNGSDEDAAKFLSTLHTRYGSLLEGSLDQDVGEADVDGDKLFLGMVPIEAELEYVLQFENQNNVHLTAKYVLFETVGDESQFKNMFEWLRIVDEKHGNLVYPSSEVIEEQLQLGK